MSADRCAFPECQAGGVILPTAPRYVDLIGDCYHPGCWDAWWLRMGQAIGRMLDRVTGTPQPVAVELDMSLEVTAR